MANDLNININTGLKIDPVKLQKQVTDELEKKNPLKVSVGLDIKDIKVIEKDLLNLQNRLFKTNMPDNLSEPYKKAFEALSRLYELKVRYASLAAPSMESANFYKSQISAQEQVYLKSVPKDNTPEFNSQFSNQLILQRIDLENQLQIQLEKTSQILLNKEKVEIEASNNSRQQTIQNLELVENKLNELQSKIMPTSGELLIDDSYRQIADDFSYLFNNLNTLKGNLDIPPDAKQSLDDLLKSYEQLYKVQADLGNVNVGTSGNFDVLKDSVGDARDEVKSFGSETRQTVGITQTLSDNVANAAAQFFTFQTAFNAARKFISDGISYLIGLDNALNEIRITTFKSASEVEELGKKYNQMAKDMSVSTKSIASAAVEYYRQGISDDNKVIENLQETIKFAQIAKLELNDAAKLITASMNSMNVSAEKASDVFAYLGDATASGIDEVAKGIQKVGGVAGSVGLELEKVGSYISVISGKTRESSESIGDSVKAILSRMKSLKEKGYAEAQDGSLTQVNEVSKALAQANVMLMDEQTRQMRDLGDVLDDLNLIWNTLDDTTKKYIATQISGVYQANRFSVLMDGYAESLQLYEGALNSAGIAQKKYDVYIESSEAAIDKFKATLEGVQQNLFNSQFLKNIINDATKLMEVLSQVAGALNSPVGSGTIAFFLTSVNVATTNTPYVQKCA